MPKSIHSSRGSQRLLAKCSFQSHAPRNTAAPRRHLSLFAITALLNTLLWSSVICVAIAIYQIAFDSNDLSNVPSGVLTLTSALVTIAYTIVHTVFSLKQKRRTSPRATSAVKKTDYVAIRILVSLCVLWLLTTGWNMIMVARRPLCLPEQQGFQRWESGFTCYISRVGTGLAAIALVASLILFGMMAVIRRPFEVHLLGNASRSPLMRPGSPTSGHSTRGRRRSTSTPSIFTNADIETLDMDTSRPPSVVHSPPPGHNSPKPDVFTSPFAPPPLPSAYATAQRGLWHQQRTVSPAPACPLPLPPQSRTSMLLPVSAYAPYSIPLELSASAQRAVYPDTSAPYRPATPRSHSHLRTTSFTQQPRYSRSLVSLTQPPRLGCVATPSPLSVSESSTPSPPSHRKRVSSAETAYALAHDEPIPGTDAVNDHTMGHWRAVSVSKATPPGMRSRQPSESSTRVAKGWRPQLQNSDTMRGRRQASIDALVRSALADLLTGPNSEHTSLDGESVDGSETQMGAVDDESRGRSVKRSEEYGRDNSEVGHVKHADHPEGESKVVSRVPADVKVAKRECYFD